MSMSGKVAKKEPLGAWGNGTGFFAEKRQGEGVHEPAH